MKSEGLKTKIFLDGGNAKETREILDILGFLDGQTTNPTLISKNPDVERRIKKGDFFNQDEILTTYERVVRDISQLIPDGSVSIEVNADKDSTPDDMLDQARNMFSWVPNGHVKFPTIPTGLRAAELAIHEGMRELT